MPMKKVINILGLPASGKSIYGKRLAEEMGFKFLEEGATQLIHQFGFKAGGSGSFQFDKAILEKNKEITKDILRSPKKETFVLEGGIITDKLYLQGRAKIGKYKQERMNLLTAYDNPTFEQLNKNSVFVIFNIPAGISLSRQEKRGKPELSTPELEILQHIHENLLNFYRENKENTIFINLMGKTEEEVYGEFKTKLLTVIEE
jgi:deoxyadenosine/deoxycytidine kinase